jgi:sugar lactone lactonase YvrE
MCRLCQNLHLNFGIFSVLQKTLSYFYDLSLYSYGEAVFIFIYYFEGSNIGVKVSGGNGEGNTTRQLRNPTDVYVDSEGNVFITDSDNNRLQMWAPNATEGILRAYMSTSQVNTVSGNSKRQDEIYVSVGASLMKYSRNSLPSFGSYLGSSSELPNGMIVDQCDTVYVTRGSLNRDGKVSKFTSSNTTEQILLSGLSIPSDVVLDQCGHLFITEAGKHQVVRYSARLGGAVEVVINKRGVSGSDSEHLTSPGSLSFDSKWNLYVSDTENHRVQKFEFLSGDMWC